MTINNIGEADDDIADLTDFAKKTIEHDLPYLYIDEHNAQLYDQVRPIRWVDPTAKVRSVFL